MNHVLFRLNVGTKLGLGHFLDVSTLHPSLLKKDTNAFF